MSTLHPNFDPLASRHSSNGLVQQAFFSPQPSNPVCIRKGILESSPLSRSDPAGPACLHLRRITSGLPFHSPISEFAGAASELGSARLEGLIDRALPASVHFPAAVPACLHPSWDTSKRHSLSPIDPADTASELGSTRF